MSEDKTLKILVSDGISKRGGEILRAEGWTVDIWPKPQPQEELIKAIPPYDALIVRSASKVSAGVLEAAENLKVVGRAGVGVDNVDLTAATRRGVIVMNSPQGNMVATAELTMALMLALARNVPQAHASMKGGKWDKKTFAGVELMGKRVGVVGLGRIGREVALRCRSFGMEIVAFDPFIAPGVAEPMNVSLVSLDELLQTSDYITLHTTLTDETRHLLRKETLVKVKPGVRIVNAARGGLIDDEALIAALEEGRVAGAALDVYASEPPKDWRIIEHPRVIATPHLGASTAEAQQKVGNDIATQIRDYLKGGAIRQAVNFFSISGELYDQVRPAMDLAQRLGSILGQLSAEAPRGVDLCLYGELNEIEGTPIAAAATAGLLQPFLHESVTAVNALAIAKEMNIGVSHSTSTTPITFSNMMELRIATKAGDLSVAGTIFGGNHMRVIEFDGVDVEAVPQGRILFVRNDDTPGVVGNIGTILGRCTVNIARMTVGRQAGGDALMFIEVDQDLAESVLGEIVKIPGVRQARAVSLPE
ncbi:MAG: phosphoglycerate dehydrogenase [Vicinamibacteria bacterium]|nr:phosphoglycerate dehydrogenase [Vicinamibacteria bacterium]